MILNPGFIRGGLTNLAVGRDSAMSPDDEAFDSENGRSMSSIGGNSHPVSPIDFSASLRAFAKGNVSSGGT